MIKALAHLGYILKWHAEITSGAYKQRKIQQGIKGGGYKDLTDEEKLTHSLGAMKRHVECLWDIADEEAFEKE